MGISIAPISAEFGSDFGIININTEFDEGLAYGLEKLLGTMFGYYQYRKVVLRINSQGGSLLALTDITDGLDHWRQKGREIHTVGTFRAASAGALLLSLGHVGTRTVNRHTSIQYHHSRVGGTAPVLTAGSADMLAETMRRIDAKLIGGLVTHIVNGFGDVSDWVDEALARCELMCMATAAIEKELDLDKSSKSQKWLTGVKRMFDECRLRGTTSAYQRYLAKRFAADTGMDLREAYCLVLIDRIKLVPSLEPFACLAKTDRAGKRWENESGGMVSPRVKAT